MFIWILTVLISLSSAAVKDPVYDELEGLNLVEALIRDGKLQMAAKELQTQTPSDRYWLLTGHLQMAELHFDKAVSSYLKAAKTPGRQLFLARAHQQLKQFPICEQMFNESQNLWLGLESDVIAKASCEFENTNWENTLKTLKLGESRFSSFAITREKTAFFLELQLSQKALDGALKAATKFSTTEILSLADLFHAKKLTNEALFLIETARARSPFDVDVNLSAAQLYYQKGIMLATVEAFERASRTERRYAYHVAELRRQLKHYRQAAYFAQLIPDSKERLKSRMALYVDQGEYPLIASMEAVFSRSELRNDDEVRYALAYSLLKQGDRIGPMAHLNRIQKPELLEKTARLKQAILNCRNNDGLCRL